MRSPRRAVAPATSIPTVAAATQARLRATSLGPTKAGHGTELVGRILRRLKRLVRSEQSLDPGRPGQNTEALAAARQHGGLDADGTMGQSNFPPGYVKADDGRPRH